jgi:tetraacyldisaccharide 4'-kinase
MKLLKMLAFPVSMLYGIITWLRNKLYDAGIFRSASFDVPVICVGNLSVGGTGKTPHIEYLIKLLEEKRTIATLSRGYGRSSSGFMEITETSTAREAGDEPLQFKMKFGNRIIVAVDKKRVHGIKKLMALHPGINTILLDDAFQHRSVSPSLNILLTDYNNIYLNDHMLPTGTLREFRSGARRADIIIVTKTPANLSPIEKRRLVKEISPKPYQQVYFSYITYGEPVALNAENSPAPFLPAKTLDIVLLTGIANPAQLEDHLSGKVKSIVPVHFPDHHEYSAGDLEKLRKIFDNFAGENKIILTTEKDAMRLKRPEIMDKLASLPVFYIPIAVKFHDKDEEAFDKQIHDHVRANPVHHRAHKESGTIRS